jgi:uncharacterized protein
MSEQATAEKLEKPKHGQFCWTELATTNLAESKKFYSELFGWQFKKGDIEGMEYSEIHLDGEKTFGGMWEMNQELCGGDKKGEMPPPHWMSYIAVEDVDASVAKVWELGGKVCVPPTDIPNVGRFAVITDPTGATFSLLTLKS